MVRDGGGPGASEVGAVGPARARESKLRPRQRQAVEGIHLRVPVAFNLDLDAQGSAAMLAEVLRHVLFMRGQLPMPYQQLLKTLAEREEEDRVAREEKATRVSGGSTILTGGPSEVAKTPRKGGGKRAKSARPLAKASAHRRARKTTTALEETTRGIEEAFLDAAEKGRPVLEALILLGASHLSPREIYSVTFPAAPVVSSGNIADSVQEGISVADAYSRKLVRCMVGGMSAVTFRNLGACRVQVFLRLGSGSPAQRFHVSPATKLTRAATAAMDASTQETAAAARTPKNSSAATEPPHKEAPRPTPPAGLLRLAPRPGFKIRTSRTRPAPKVSIVISKRVGPNARRETSRDPGGASAGASVERQSRPDFGGHHGAVDGCEGHPRESESGGGERLEGRGGRGVGGGGGEQAGLWYQVVCGRLAGLKGCDSLAN